MGPGGQIKPVLYWNYRGLGNPMTVASLTDLVRQFSPSMVFLSKTKCDVTEINKFQRRTALVNGVWVELKGKAGGLALNWNKEEDINVRSMSSRHIDVSIRHFSGEYWRFTGIYEWSEHGQKQKTWDLVRHLGKDSEMAWVIRGDFNEILFTREKLGGNPCDFGSLKAFRDVLDCFNLSDISSKGYLFTWCNGQSEGFIEEHLDRAVANKEWHDLFRDPTVETVIWYNSDHYPICIRLEEQQNPKTRRHLLYRKIFKFEVKWLPVERFDEILNFWTLSTEIGQSPWMKAVKQCGKLLMKWDKETFKRSQ